jgi:hypothetical protein
MQTVTTPDVSRATLEIPVRQISRDPGQPRQIFDKVALRELATSIRVSGLLQPITVRQLGEAAYAWPASGAGGQPPPSPPRSSALPRPSHILNVACFLGINAL